jgi:hypothetical protein
VLLLLLPITCPWPCNKSLSFALYHVQWLDWTCGSSAVWAWGPNSGFSFGGSVKENVPFRCYPLGASWPWMKGKDGIGCSCIHWNYFYSRDFFLVFPLWIAWLLFIIIWWDREMNIWILRTLRIHIFSSSDLFTSGLHLLFPYCLEALLGHLGFIWSIWAFAICLTGKFESLIWRFF